MNAIETIRDAIGKVESEEALFAIFTGDPSCGFIQIAPGVCETSLYGADGGDLIALGFLEDAGVGVWRRHDVPAAELIHAVLVQRLGMAPGAVPAVEFD